MPLYEYECAACGRRFEVIHKFSDPSVDVCKECGKGPVHRLVSSAAIQFKGSGWYITDYAQKGKSDSSSEMSDGKTGDSAKPDTATDGGAAKAAKSETTKSETTKSETPSSASKSKDS